MWRSEEHTSELQSQSNLVCRLLLEKKNSLTWAWLGNRRRHRPSSCPATYGVRRPLVDQLRTRFLALHTASIRPAWVDALAPRSPQPGRSPVIRACPLRWLLFSCSRLRLGLPKRVGARHGKDPRRTRCGLWRATEHLLRARTPRPF